MEGLNYGLPTTFIKLGPGAEFTSEALVKDVIVHTRCKWVCIFGESTTQVGMGTLIKGLSTVGLYIEVEVSGGIRDPGWMHSVDRWLVDYVKGGSFNYSALRTQDMIRFVVRNQEELNRVKVEFEELKLFSGTKFIKIATKDVIPKSGNKKLLNSTLYREAFALVRKYERGRLYLEGK